MKNLILVSLVAVLSLVSALALAQPDKGGSTLGGDTKGTPSEWRASPITRMGTSVGMAGGSSADES